MSRRRWLKWMVRTACVAAAGACVYTRYIEPFWVEVVQRPLPIRHLPASMHGRKLVQLSDLHIGPQVSDSYLCQTFRLVDELQPDYIVITGDFMTLSGAQPPWDQLEAVLPQLPHGQRGTIGILGNHDYGIDWWQPEIPIRLCQMAESHGVRMLRNGWGNLDELRVAGFDVKWGPKFNPLPTMKLWDPQQPSLVLCHNPDVLDLPVWAGYQGWTLSGHTHGGQCKPPFLPPPLLPVANKLYTAGEFTLQGGRRLYINRGLGHLLKVRFNVRPEITVFTLESTV